MLNLSKHPIDWLIHFFACLGTVYFGTPIWIAILFWLYIEYEQKGLADGYSDMSWREYFWQHSLGDIIADILGIIVGALI